MHIHTYIIAIHAILANTLVHARAPNPSPPPPHTHTHTHTHTQAHTHTHTYTHRTQECHTCIPFVDVQYTHSSNTKQKKIPNTHMQAYQTHKYTTHTHSRMRLKDVPCTQTSIKDMPCTPTSIHYVYRTRIIISNRIAITVIGTIHPTLFTSNLGPMH